MNNDMVALRNRGISLDDMKVQVTIMDFLFTGSVFIFLLTALGIVILAIMKTYQKILEAKRRLKDDNESNPKDSNH